MGEKTNCLPILTRCSSCSRLAPTLAGVKFFYQFILLWKCFEAAAVLLDPQSHGIIVCRRCDCAAADAPCQVKFPCRSIGRLRRFAANDAKGWFLGIHPGYATSKGSENWVILRFRQKAKGKISKRRSRDPLTLYC